MSTYLGAIDQGTTSTRFIIFDSTGRIVFVSQKEHERVWASAPFRQKTPAILHLWTASPVNANASMPMQQRIPHRADIQRQLPLRARAIQIRIRLIQVLHRRPIRRIVDADLQE
jgi:hypothetical protein